MQVAVGQERVERFKSRIGFDRIRSDRWQRPYALRFFSSLSAIGRDYVRILCVVTYTQVVARADYVKHARCCIHNVRAARLETRQATLADTRRRSGGTILSTRSRGAILPARAPSASARIRREQGRGLNLSGDENLARNILVTPLSAFHRANNKLPLPLPRRAASLFLCGCIKPELTLSLAALRSPSIPRFITILTI